SGNVNFGQNRNKAFFRIAYHFPYFLLSVITPVIRYFSRRGSFTVPPSARARYPPGTYRGESGQALNLNPPALVVGQVPMKAVHIVLGQLINVSFDKGNREEMPAYVQHQPPPAKSGKVGDAHAGDFPLHIVYPARCCNVGR